MYRRFAHTQPVSGTDADSTVYWYNHSGRTIAVVQSTVKFIPDVSVSAHASNTMLFELKSGSTVIADWDTTTGQEGALTAGTAASMVAGAAAGKTLECASGSCLSLVATNSGTGPAYGGYVSFEYIEVA